MEFNIIVPQGHFVRLADWELVLPIRFRTEANVPINLGEYIPVNNFFRHYLETLTMSCKEDMKAIVRPRPSGSIATYIQSMMEDMIEKQLQVIEIDIFFDKTQVLGNRVHYHLPAQLGVNVDNLDENNQFDRFNDL